MEIIRPWGGGFDGIIISWLKSVIIIGKEVFDLRLVRGHGVRHVTDMPRECVRYSFVISIDFVVYNDAFRRRACFLYINFSNC